MTTDEKNILKLFRILAEEDKKSLKSYLEFLAQKSDVKNKIPEAPLEIPRPENETVVAAIKRLRKTYPMLDSTELLNKTSEIMTSHLLKGISKKDAIDDLENYFRQTYEKSN